MSLNRTILIVDDEQLGREILRVLLASEFDLAFASTGQEALEKAKRLSPDLILLDVMMPHMDGFEVCRRLRAAPDLAEVPILLVTALSDRASRLQGIEAGADDFVTKPFDKVELKTRIQSIIRLNRYRRLLVERTKFERVVERAKDGYIIITSQDQIIYANPTARLYLGLENEEPAFNHSFLQLAKKQYQCEPFYAWIVWPGLPEPDIPQPEATRYLIRPESDTSNPFWLELSVTWLPTSSPEQQFLIQMTDVTNQMALQQDMSSFHAMVSHKMRTPLISMVSSLELMAGYASRLTTNEIVEFAQVALNGVQRLKGQIEDILQYLSRPTSADPVETGFNLNDLQTVISKIRDNLTLEAVILQSQTQLESDTVRLSERNVEIILWEVFENAKKFHPKQFPQIEIDLRPIDSSRLMIRISDDGVHLSPEQLNQILTPYYQGEKLFTGEIKGMGLGLPTAVAIVWSVGGKCRVYNRSDRPGLVVEFILDLISKQK